MIDFGLLWRTVAQPSLGEMEDELGESNMHCERQKNRHSFMPFVTNGMDTDGRKGQQCNDTLIYFNLI